MDAVFKVLIYWHENPIFFLVSIHYFFDSILLKVSKACFKTVLRMFKKHQLIENIGPKLTIFYVAEFIAVPALCPQPSLF